MFWTKTLNCIMTCDDIPGCRWIIVNNDVCVFMSIFNTIKLLTLNVTVIKFSFVQNLKENFTFLWIEILYNYIFHFQQIKFHPKFNIQSEIFIEFDHNIILYFSFVYDICNSKRNFHSTPIMHALKTKLFSI